MDSKCVMVALLLTLAVASAMQPEDYAWRAYPRKVRPHQIKPHHRDVLPPPLDDDSSSSSSSSSSEDKSSDESDESWVKWPKPKPGRKVGYRNSYGVVASW